MLREKKTANIAVKTTERVQEDLTKRAHLAGLSVSEYVHNLLMLNLYGRDHVESLYQRMLCVVSGPADKDLPETSLRAVAKKCAAPPAKRAGCSPRSCPSARAKCTGAAIAEVAGPV